MLNPSILALRNEILSITKEIGLTDSNYVKILDFVIELFEKNSLGVDYYGYHNIEHELEATYISLLAVNGMNSKEWKIVDGKYIYVAALLHDFDPEKNVDKPHEESVIKFVKKNKELLDSLKKIDVDINIVQAMILRTIYPWKGEEKKQREREIEEHLSKSSVTKDSSKNKEHFRELGWTLSVSERIGGYALGGFLNALELAKKNAHASALPANEIAKKSVEFFAQLYDKESKMCNIVLDSIPNHMKKNFLSTIKSFKDLREREIKIKKLISTKKIKLVTIEESMENRLDGEFIQTLFRIYEELPRPLQFKKDEFWKSVRDSNTILNTVRIKDGNGEIVGFAKGGPLEEYKLREDLKDKNYGKHNTVFLEPFALKAGYWSSKGGHGMRLLFLKQAKEKGYKYLTGFALRDVIQSRIDKGEKTEFVQKFDPERWDYRRVIL